jgi:sporulation protein YlmC with PRC-barrel domain
LPVVTVSGAQLGRVHDFELDPIEQRIIRYSVRSGRLIGDLLSRELLIASRQVVSLSDEKMVVDDAVRPVESAPGVSGKPAVSIQGTS